MASYRDDMQDTATVSGRTWLGLKAVTEEVARVSAAVFSTLLFLVADEAVASDAVFDNARTIIVEQAEVYSYATGNKRRIDLITDSARLSEQYQHCTVQTINEAALINGASLETIFRAVLDDSALVSSGFASHKIKPKTLNDYAKARSFVIRIQSDLAEDSAQAFSLVMDKGGYSTLITETLKASNVIIENIATSSAITEFTRISSNAYGRVSAVSLVDDSVLAIGGVIEQSAVVIWTANTDNWAMSNYFGIDCEQLAVVNGRLLAITKSGISEIGKESSELISAKLETDQIQITGDQKTHPVSALMDYSLNGGMAASLALTTRQSDTPETYHYPLSGRLESEYASGRFIFGRGLRAKKIALSLTITAKSGLVNSLNIETAESKRRI